MNKEQYLEEYNILSEQKKKIELNIKKLKENAMNNGFTFNENKFVDDELVYVLEYDLIYYSHFDGHRSEPIYEEESERKIIDQKIVDAFIKAKTIDAEKFTNKETEEISNIIWECIYNHNLEDFYKVLKYINHKSKDIFSWKYNGSSSQGELDNDSYIRIYKNSLSNVKCFKIK